MTILVTGATGNVGRHVVNHLLQAGQRVRVLLRDRAALKKLPSGVEAVYGNLTQPETLVPALKDVTGMHLMTMASGELLKTGAEIIELATKAGVKRVTVLWSGERGPVEPIVEASDLEWTQLQPVEYMSNALLWADSIRAEGVVREPFPNNLNAMVHESDIGAVAAKTLVEGGHAGKTYTLTGPEALTIPDKIRIISDAIGQDIRFVELTKEQARERLIKSGVADDMADHVIGWYENPPKAGYIVNPTVEEITGRPAKNFAEWASEHIADFR